MIKTQTEPRPDHRRLKLVKSENRPAPSQMKPRSGRASDLRVALLTAGRDRPYALGLAGALIGEGIPFDFIGSDAVDSPILHGNPLVTFLNLRVHGEGASLPGKVYCILSYYARLMIYALVARPRIFHILWNNKFEWFDRTLLMLFYRLCGRKLVFTAHNVNAGTRDSNDSFLNRLTLRIQYGLAHHIFVHTEPMRRALQSEFSVRPERCSVIPFGINSTVPDTDLDGATARIRLGLGAKDRVLLFFGNIAPYKGLEYLIEALGQLRKDGGEYQLIIAGRVKDAEAYWQGIEDSIARLKIDDSIVRKIQYVPDEDTEIYFKAADVLVLPYRHIYQSGVLFLGYNFGLPVVASDVGTLKEDILEGTTGFVCLPEDPEDLARTLQVYFDSSLYSELPHRRQHIRNFASERYSWSRVAEISARTYSKLLDKRRTSTND
jgi:D-inositol-3-phosphate glycosyltransferase